MRTEAEKQALKNTIKCNKHEVYILSLEEMDNIFSAKATKKWTKEQWEKIKNKAEFSANYTAAGKDTVLLARLIGDLGFSGTKAYIKNYGGKAHIILKGYPGLRNIFNGTKYGLQNAKVIKMGMGKYGAVNSVKGGGVLTIILLSIYRVADYFLRDGATLNQLIGSLATDVVKVGIATGASIAAVSVTATWMATTGILVALGPLAVAIVVGVGVTMLLEYADSELKITDRVIAALDEIEEKGIKGIIEEKKQAIVRKGNEIINGATESVIDYAIESTQRILLDAFNRLLRNTVMPRI